MKYFLTFSLSCPALLSFISLDLCGANHLLSYLDSDASFRLHPLLTSLADVSSPSDLPYKTVTDGVGGQVSCLDVFTDDNQQLRFLSLSDRGIIKMWKVRRERKSKGISMRKIVMMNNLTSLLVFIG